MDKSTAQTVLKAVELKYAKWISLSKADGATDPDDFPRLVENYTFGIENHPAPFAIVWECNAPDEWTQRWGSAKREDPPGTFCEPIYSYVLGIYDGD